MRVLKSRRPKSAMNAVKQKMFSSFLSQARMGGIQNICKTEQLDCILIVLGIDSRFNRGCTELIEYLLFDVMATRKADIERTNADEVLFEDLMICVHPNFVDIYCNPVNYWLLIPYISHWPGLRIHCMSEDEFYDDSDKCEDFKVEALNRMVDGAKNIGIPYFSTREDLTKIKFEKMLVEHWPVLQATALEKISGGTGSGFFTLNHTVIDVSSRVHSLLREVDPVCLESLYNKVMPAFEAQFESIFQILDSHRSDTREWTSSRFGEPLVSYFQHGCAVLANSEMKNDFRPFVLFGKNTERQFLLPVLNGLPPNVEPLESPTHFVVQGSVPRHPDLVCARTYFLHGTSALDWRKESPDNGNDSRNRLQKIKILCSAYASLVSSMEKAAELLYDKKPVKDVEAEAKRFIMSQQPSVTEKNIQIEIGNSSPKAGVGGAQMFHLQGVIYNMTTSTGELLGSVLYADSVVVSTLEVETENGLAVRGSAARLTFGVPRFQFWSGEDLVALRKELSETYGSLVAMDTVDVFLPSEGGIVKEFSCVFFETHVLFHNKRQGNSLIAFSNITYFEGESMGDLSFLMIGCSVGDSNVSFHMNKDSYVLICVQTKTRFKTSLYSKLIPLWKKEGVLEMRDSLPPPLASSLAFLRTQRPHAASLSGLDKALERQPGLRDFFKHLEVAHCLRYREPVPEQHLPTLLSRTGNAAESAPEEEEAEAAASLVLTVVCGMPGSYKEQLCACLTRLVKDETRWMVFRPPSLEALEDLRDRLNGAVTASPRRPIPGQNRKVLRGLLCCPAFVGPSHVAKLVEGLKTVRIGAVTVCVEPSSAFLENKLTMPLLLDQCANGWANNIIFTSEGRSDSTEVEDLQALLRCLNPKVTAIHAVKGEVTRAAEIDAILSETAFCAPELVQARLLGGHGLKYPSSISCIPPALETHQIKFDRPLSRSALMKVLKNMKASLKPWRYVGNIYFVQGKVTFPNGGGRMLEFWHSALSGATWTQNLDAVPSPPGAPPAHRSSSVTFIGCGLEVPILRDWLRKAAPAAPVRKPLRTRADLSGTELETIHKTKHLNPLPPGWFYNGIQFMTMDGTKVDRHPEFERHVEEYLEEANAAIRKRNERIDPSNYHDLFEV